MVAPLAGWLTVPSMTDKMEWQGQVGSSWAREWQRTDRSFAPLTQRLIERIIVAGDAERIADIGCGAGELSIKLADALPAADILGLDISSDLIVAATERGSGRSNLNFAVADAATWRDPHFAPDLLVSRHGVMFFDDPVSAFANADRVKAIFAAASWSDVAFEAVDFDYVAGSGADPVADALDFFGHIGPAARAIRLLEGDAQTAFVSRLRELAEAHLQDGAVRFAAAAWIVTAQKSFIRSAA